MTHLCTQATNLTQKCVAWLELQTLGILHSVDDKEKSFKTLSQLGLACYTVGQRQEHSGRTHDSSLQSRGFESRWHCCHQGPVI
jgi:hypothetical protein